jgi:large subunit ribosomal protein L35
MPKLKTHKGVKKRIHITGSGRIMRAKGGKSHLRLAKAKRVKRQYGEMIEVHAADRAKIRRLIPYGVK